MSDKTITIVAPEKVQISGELIFATVPTLLEQGNRFIEKVSAKIIFDLQQVTRSDSAGLALLVEWLRLAKKLNREILFLNSPQQLLAIAKVSGLEKLIEL